MNKNMLYLGADVEIADGGPIFKLNNAAVISLVRRLKAAEDVVSVRGNTRSIDDGLSALLRKCHIVAGWMYARGALQWNDDQIRAVDELMVYAQIGGPQFCAWFEEQWSNYELERRAGAHERCQKVLEQICIRDMREACKLTPQGKLTLPCPDMATFRKRMIAAWAKRLPHGVMWFQRNRGKPLRRWSTSKNGPLPVAELTTADAATNAMPPLGWDDAGFVPAAPHDYVISPGAGNQSPDGHFTTDLF